MTQTTRPNLVVGLAILAAIGVAFVLIANAIAAPWIYAVGGGRLLPNWQGQAEMSGPGGEYRLYLSFAPSPTKVAGTHVRGNGWICAPSGRAYPLKVGGGTRASIWKNMDGQAFHIYTFGYSPEAAIGGMSVPPKLDFLGRWEGDALRMTDGGSLAASFSSDGMLRSQKLTSAEPPQPVLFREKGWGFSGLGWPCG